MAAATGAVSNAALQLAANGKINFGQLLQSALSAGATAGIAHLPGVGQHRRTAAAGFASDFLGGIMGDALQNHPGTAATDAQAQGQTPQETAAPAQPGQTPAANSTVTVGRGDTLEQLARQHYGENWRAGLTALVAANPGLRTNRWGSPLITPGQTLNAPSLQGLSAEQLARLGHTGGQIIGRNSQGLNARAQWLAAQQARAAAAQAARQSQGMSPDEAYARYMAGGGRSGSYQRALGENYRTTWHTPSASRPGSSALTQTLSDIAARTAGAITGTAGSFADMAEGSWRIARNSALQVGDILTFGYNHDHPVMQQAWSEQQQLGQSIVNAMLSPRETTSGAIESVVNRYEAAMRIKDPYAQSQALGRLFNDVGQAALGLGYSSPAVFRPGVALGRAIGENAFTGPPAGSRGAQRGAVGDLGGGSPVGGTTGRRGADGTDTPIGSQAVGSLTVQEMLFQATGTQYNNGSLTPAGRAATKHPEYFGFNSTNELRSVYRGDPQLNEIARQHIIDILQNGVRTTGAGGRYPDGWITYTLPDGRAASWHASGQFIGFRGMKK